MIEMYSTLSGWLRADPLGVKGIYEALDRLPGVDASRNFRALPKLKPAAPVTLVYAGVTPHALWESRELSEFDSLVLDGTRAIFTFLPYERAPIPEQEKRADDEERAKKEKGQRREEKAARKKARRKAQGRGNKKA